MPNGEAPMYRRIAARILDAIKSGEITSNSQLPSEMELAKTFGVNRLTVRQAISELQRLNAVRIERGRGTYVTSPPDHIEVVMNLRATKHHDDTQHRSTSTGDDDAPTHEIITRVGESAVVPTAANELSSQNIIEFNTHMFRGEELWILSTYYIDAAYREVEKALPKHNYFVRALRKHYDLSLEYGWRAFSAQAASFEDAEAFGVALGTPLLVRDGVTRVIGGDPLFYVRRRLLGERAKFVLLYSNSE